MLALTLIRLLRDTLCLVAVLGILLTVLLVQSELVMYSMQTDWRLGSENQIMLLFVAATSLLCGISWFFAQRKEWALMDRRNLKSRLMRFTVSFPN